MGEEVTKPGEKAQQVSFYPVNLHWCALSCLKIIFASLLEPEFPFLMFV